MPRPKKERGRPLEHLYPPRIDATAEELAQTMLRRPVSPWAYEKGESTEYRCKACEKPVNYPETLYEGGLCANCRPA